jgi:Ala-tRNA(Pro) deacylase
MHAQETQSPDLPALPTSPEDLFALLKSLNIPYSLHHHPPIFTVADGEHLKASIPGVHCRNLFLRDKKKKAFLVVLANETAVDLKALEGMLGCGRLSFGSAERLWEMLGIRPGSVCPFTLVNDKNRDVHVVLDQSMMEAEIVNYHPLDNAMTIGLSPADLLKFITHTGHDYRIVAF